MTGASHASRVRRSVSHRGAEYNFRHIHGTYRYLDLAPLGRNEQTPADWWRRHDEYENAGPRAST